MSSIHLVMFMTRGMSFQVWENIGMFDREVAIYKGLQEKGIRVSIVTYGGRSELDFADRIPGIKILCNQWGLSLPRYERWIPWLHAMTLRKADIIKTNQISGGEFAFRAAMRWKKKFVARGGYLYSVHTKKVYGAESKEMRKALEVENTIYPAADVAVVTTRTMKEFIVDNYPVPADRVTIIPNYVQTDVFSPVEMDERKPGQICFIGRLEDQKNPFAFLDAIKDLDVELLMIGSGSLEGELKYKVKEEQLPVQFLGNIAHHDLPDILAKSDVFVLPSHYEGHPKTMLEAMSCGLPVIGADSVGINDVLVDGENGVLCGTQADEIRKAIVNLMNSHEEKERLGRAARNYILSTCSLESVIELELQLYRRLLENIDE